MTNRIVRKYDAEGNLGRGFPMCEKHINQADPEGIVITEASTGQECELCRLEAQEDADCIDPVLINNTVGEVVSTLSEGDQQFVTKNPQLLTMLAGFVYALLLVKIPRPEVVGKARDTLMKCWTGVREKEE